MGRPLRIEYPGALYHVTSRGNERMNLFLDDSDREKFLATLEDYHERHSILLHCYVLMDNHYHLVMETPLANLTKVMHGLNSGYTGYFNRKYGRTGHLFQGRYQAILVDKETYLVELSRYVHLNPVKAGIVETPAHYAWSSYPGYVGETKEVPWVEYSWVLSQVGRDKKKSKKEYKEFVEEGVQNKENKIFNDLHGQIILGGREFIEKAKRMLKHEEISQEIVERKRFKAHTTPDDIMKAVASEFGVGVETLKKKRSKDTTAKKVAIYLTKRYSGLTNQEIGVLFGGMHYSAVSKASSRLEGEIAKKNKLASLVKELMSHVKT